MEQETDPFPDSWCEDLDDHRQPAARAVSKKQATAKAGSPKTKKVALHAKEKPKAEPDTKPSP